MMDKKKKEGKKKKKDKKISIVPLRSLVNYCWEYKQPGNMAFTKILEQPDGHLVQLKKEIPLVVVTYSDRLREMIHNKYKEGSYSIEFMTLWKMIIKVYGEKNAEPAMGFFKILLQYKEPVTQVKKIIVDRVCDWLKGVDPFWMSNYADSFFYKHYMGEKTSEDIKKDTSIHDRDISNTQAFLHWDSSSENGLFCVTVRYEEKSKPSWYTHEVKEKDKVKDPIGLAYFNANKIKNLFFNQTRYQANSDPIWAKSSVFDPVKPRNFVQNYTSVKLEPYDKTTGQTDKYDSVYVF